MSVAKPLCGGYSVGAIRYDDDDGPRSKRKKMKKKNLAAYNRTTNN